MTPASVTNRYAALEGDDLRAHLSRFLASSWSYSGVAAFARNEKEFERRYIYHEPARVSPASVAGTAYHAALQLYFERLMGGGTPPSVPEMQARAYEVIDGQPANTWKLAKKTPTVELSRAAATQAANRLIAHFAAESSVYTDGLASVIGVELRMEFWPVVNGVDIPLPCHAVVDLIVRLGDGRTVVVDHKSKISYTDETDARFVIGKQAITYALGYETLHPGERVDEVWFIENKIPANSDGSPQLRRHAVVLDPDTRRLYESILYEPLRRMMQALADPDYVYTINDNDMLADRAGLYDFWAKTLIADIDAFNIPDDKRGLISRRLKKIRDAQTAAISPKVITSFRRQAAAFIPYELREDMQNSEKIEHILRSFGITVRVAHQLGEYASASYLLEIGAGVKIANVAKYALDIANVLNVPSARVLPELVMRDSRAYLCVEVPSRSGATLDWDVRYLDGHKIPLGVDNFGDVVRWDLESHSTPHMLICGATGSGKSVCIRSTIAFARSAGVGEIIIFDPKYEFADYGDTCEVVSDIADIEARMKSLVNEMQRRSRQQERKLTLVIFDEFADAVASARSGKELDIKEMVEVGTRRGPLGFPEPKMELRVTGREKSLEENLKMLLQKGRSLGFRVVAATQRASTKVITGDAKVNFPVQVCFRVPKAVDSKVVLDEEGAESLAGRGDALIKSPEYIGVRRFQGFFKS